MLRIQSTLDETTEAHVSTIIDCGITVHRTLGPGFVESVYHNALCLELDSRAIPFESERSIVVQYREKPVGIHRMDLVVYDAVFVELKAAKHFHVAHHAQILLMNFGGATLAQGLRRIVH